MIDKIKATELRLQGKTYEQIANLFGVSRQRIHQILTGYIPKNQGVNQSNYREKHRDSINAQMRDYLQGKYRQKHKALKQRENEQIKKAVLVYYGQGQLHCVKCGFSDIRALSIDHIDGKGNLHKEFSYRWLIKNNYPEGYQTLCMNCQWIKRHTNNEVQRTDIKNILVKPRNFT